MNIKKNISIFIKNNGIYISIVLFNFIFLCYCIFKIGVVYESPDDFAIVSPAAGSFGFYSPYIMFGNIIYGFILKCLYSLTTSFSWITFSYLFFMFISYNCIGYVLVKKLGKIIGFLTFCSFLFMYFGETYTLINFTRVSSLAAISGYILLIYCLVDNNYKKQISNMNLQVVGSLLIVYSSMVRFNAFLLVSGFALWYFGFDFIYKLIKKEKHFIELLNNYIGLILVLLIILGSNLFNNYIYNSNSELKYYKDFNNYRSNLFDYGIPVYDEFESQYNSIGFSRIDYNNLINYEIADPDKYNVETFSAIFNFKKGFYKNNIDLKDYINIWFVQFKNYIYIYSLSLLFIFCFISTKSWKSICIVLGMLSISLLEMFYLYYFGRILGRVTFLISMCISIILLLNITFSISKLKNIRKIIYCIIIFIFIIFKGHNIFSISKSHIIYSSNANISNVLNIFSKTDNLYVWDVHAATLIASCYNIFSSPPSGILNNCIFSGGWRTNSPAMNKVLKNHNEVNVFSSILKNPKTFVIGDTNVDLKLNYLREKYNSSANYSIYEQFPSVNVYAFSSNFESLKTENFNWGILSFHKDTHQRVIYNKWIYLFI